MEPLNKNKAAEPLEQRNGGAAEAERSGEALMLRDVYWWDGTTSGQPQVRSLSLQFRFPHL